MIICREGDWKFKRDKANSVDLIFKVFVFGIIPVRLFLLCISLIEDFSNDGFVVIILSLIPVLFIMMGLVFFSELFSKRCPFCKHFGVLKRYGGKVLNYTTQSEVSQDYDTYDQATTMDLNGNFYVTNITSRHTQYGTETSDHITQHFVCECCRCIVKRRSVESHTRWH